MVQAIINISEKTNRVLNIIKAQFGLKDKSQAIDMMAKQYEKEVMDYKLKPKFIEKIKRIEKEPTVKVKNFKKHFGLK